MTDDDNNDDNDGQNRLLNPARAYAARGNDLSYTVYPPRLELYHIIWECLPQTQVLISPHNLLLHLTILSLFCHQNFVSMKGTKRLLQLPTFPHQSY